MNEDKLKNNSSIQKDTLSIFQIAVMTTICVASLRTLPPMAEEGRASILMYIIPAILFLIPTSLVSAEFATTYKGGIYVWIREAFGNRMGFVAIWLQWIQNVVWYPVQLAFVAAALAFTINRGDLSNSGLFTAVIIIVVYWLSTFLAFKGGNLFAKVSSIGGMIGVLVPGAILIVLGVLWMAQGQPISESYLQSSYIPKITGISSLVLIVSNVLSYAGMEMNAVHAGQMENPKKDFTKAIALAFILILCVFIFPTLAIAIAIPADKLGMANGIMVAFQEFFEKLNISWMSNVISGAMFFGAISSVVTWVAGPSKGLLDAGKTGLLPPILQKVNKNNVQVNILIFQGIIVTILAMIYVLFPDVSDVFIALIGMAAALYVIMYMLMFAAIIVLRKKEPNIERGYKVPAVNIVSGIGFISCALAFVMSFIPTTSEAAIPRNIYPIVVAIVVFLLGIPPFIFYMFKKPSWDMRTAQEKGEKPIH